jgi:hypothetical protein
MMAHIAVGFYWPMLCKAIARRETPVEDLNPWPVSESLQRLLAMRKARIWRAFRIEERKFFKNKTAKQDCLADLGGFELTHSQLRNAL